VELAGSPGAGAPGDEPAALITVPDLRGQTMRDAARVLGAMGLRLEPTGTGLAVRQDPPPGSHLPPGASVRVEFEPPPPVEEEPGAERSEKSKE
ncbi:MAG: PASTA domain-containing protein, partial [Clostridia bacterium]|nr:PASTA domain-containing protein [Clostridia bacterium]